MAKLTLDQLLELARYIASNTLFDNRARQLAEGVLDLLEGDLPCGYETPTVFVDQVEIPAALATAADTRLLAAAALRGGDWIRIDRETYIDALATSRLSAEQDINTTLQVMLEDSRRRS